MQEKPYSFNKQLFLRCDGMSLKVRLTYTSEKNLLHLEKDRVVCPLMFQTSQFQTEFTQCMFITL